MKNYKVTVVFKEFGLTEPTITDFAAGLMSDLMNYKPGMVKYFMQDKIVILIEDVDELLPPGTPDGRD